MLDRYEAEKADRIAAAVERIAPEGDRSARQRFTQLLYARGSAEDLVECSAEELSAHADQSWAILQERPSGEHLISVVNPTYDVAGHDHLSLTVIDIVNDNMPFLFDSVMNELYAFGADVSLVLHPIYACRRDDAGRLVEFLGEA